DITGDSGTQIAFVEPVDAYRYRSAVENSPLTPVNFESMKSESGSLSPRSGNHLLDGTYDCQNPSYQSFRISSNSPTTPLGTAELQDSVVHEKFLFEETLLSSHQVKNGRKTF